MTHGRAEVVGPAIDRLYRVAAVSGVELLFDPDEARKHGLEPSNARTPDIAVVLGGDGTMLRALTRFLGTGVPVIGVNFGHVGFLTTIPEADLEEGLFRVFAGESQTIELPTIGVAAAGKHLVAVNDAVITSGIIGRIVALEYSIGGEEVGVQRCDGLISSTPTGSTAYNLSNGGPVLVWGIEAMVLTFIAPHSLHVRPLVVPPGVDIAVTNRTVDVPTRVLVDGHAVGGLQPGESVTLRVGEQRSLLATLPESTFFRRYAATFGH